MTSIYTEPIEKIETWLQGQVGYKSKEEMDNLRSLIYGTNRNDLVYKNKPKTTAKINSNPITRCEWNPDLACPAWRPKAHGDCVNNASVIASKGDDIWHICDRCSKLPPFKKFRIKRFTRKLTR
jgi:hypothetical protein